MDLEFDGSSELFVTMCYRRYAYTSNLAGCNPILSSLICRHNPYCVLEEVGSTAGDEDDTASFDVIYGSEFEDVDGRVSSYGYG